MDLDSIRNKISLLETQFGAADTSSLAQALGEINNYIIDNLSNIPVGSIVQSELDETDFQTIMSSDWLLMNGQSASGSTYQTLTGNANVPDFRASFLRGKNNGRSDGKENPNGDLALGTVSPSQMGNHNHSTSFSHNFVEGFFPEQNVHIGGPNFHVVRGAGLSFAITGPQNLPAGSHADENPTAGSEVRLRASIVNFFIKVN